MTHPKHDNFIEGNWESISGVHRFCHEAMATTFEVIIQHEDSRYAQQAARAAFDELDRLEADLSRFIENSDISRINHLAVNQPLTIGPAAFECLLLSTRMYSETNGAFDITIGSRCQEPDARIEYPIKLDEAQYSVELMSSAVQIDLGGIGKGYAVDKMAESLREWSIETALICGGYSSILALNAPDNTSGWPVTLRNPNKHEHILARPYLKGRAVGASGVQKGRHIIDPRTGCPAEGKIAAWVCTSEATTVDALSTAFMVMSTVEIEQFCERYPDIMAMVILQEEGSKTGKEKVLHFGRWEGVLK